MFPFSTSLLFLLLTPIPALAAFPKALTLSDDATLEFVLADIPFFSVGLLGFGVFTFFFVMRRISRLTVIAHLSVFAAFLGSIFDLSHIIQQGSINMAALQGIQNSLNALTVLRELSFSASIGLRFMFFWIFVAEPPRGELPPLPIPDDRRPNFITLDSDAILHSAHWSRWTVLGLILKWSLLAMTIAIVVLQAVWRIAPDLRRFGTVYNIDGTLQIVVSSLYILKLFANAYLSPLTPRWKTMRDYSPVILALAISMGVGIGNILCFEFSESTLGRFLQAVELYILTVFVLISAFYKMPVRASVVAELVRRRLGGTAFDRQGQNTANRESRFSMTGRPNSSSSRANSGQLALPNENSRPSLSQRLSTTSKISSWLVRRTSNRASVEGDRNRLWTQGDAEKGRTSMTNSQRGSFDQQSPAGPNEAATWKDPAKTSVVKEKDFRPKVNRIPPPITVPQVSDNRFTLQTNYSTVPSASAYTVTSARPPIVSGSQRPFSQDTTGSPIFGLDGVVRTRNQGEPQQDRRASDSSAMRSAGMDSLLRQQQELDRSIAGLRSFSSSTRLPSRIQSLVSDFSLSNFPEPPARVNGADPPTPSTARADIASNQPSMMRRDEMTKDDSLMVDDIAFQLVPPSMPAIKEDKRQDSRDSDDSVLPRGMRLDSQGTQYDVTSFIGGLSNPMDGIGQAPPPMSAVREATEAESDDEGIGPATIAALTRGRLIDPRRLPEVENVKSSNPAKPVVTNVPTAPMAVRMGKMPGLPSQPAPMGKTALAVPPQPIGPPPSVRPPAPESPPQVVEERTTPTAARPRGLTNRRMLEISNPIRRRSNTLDERAAFERPRPAPLVLQGANDREPAAPSRPDGADGSFF